MRPAVLVVALIALSLALASCSVKTSFKAGDTSSTDDTGGSADAGKDGGKEAASGPSVVAMRVGDVYDEEKQQVTNESDEFAPDTPEIHMDADLTGLATGSTLTATLTAVAVTTPDGKAIEDEEVNSIDWQVDEPDLGVYAKFSAPDAGWPPGRYVIDLSVGDDVLQEAEFTVKAGEDLNAPRTP